jgi:hypothetical protein
MSSHPPRTNLLLDALSGASRQRLLPQLQWVEMPLGRVLHESGGAMG